MARSKRVNPKPPTRRRAQRPQRLTSIPAIPRGPKLYRLPKELQQGTTGPGHPPPGFITATNSVSEWWLYFALAKVIGMPKDPREGPFIGYPPIWRYQVDFAGGRDRAGGGNVLDFVVDLNPLGDGQPVAIRLQTYRFHGATDAVKQAREQLYKSRLSRMYRVVDIWETAFLNDKTGQAVVIQVKDALRGVTPENPVRGGTLVDVRDRPKSPGN